MKCPKCGVELDESDFHVCVYPHAVEIEVLCLECDASVILGFDQKELEDAWE